MSENTNSSSGNSGNQGGSQKPTLSWSQPAASPKPVAPVTPTKSTPATPVVKTTPAPVQANHASQSNMGTYVGIFVGGLIVGALIGWGITGAENKGSTPTAANATTTATSANTYATSTQSTAGTVNLKGSTLGANNTATNISLAATQPAGFTVAVSKVAVTEPTWLVVYEDHNGTFGNAIGAGLFFAGDTSGTIELLRATLPGQSYYVGQSLDDGDRVFSLSADKSVLDANGNPLFTAFTAQ